MLKTFETYRKLSGLWKNVGLRKGSVRDPFIVSVLGGLAGTIVMDISNAVLWLLGGTDTTYGHISGTMAMVPFKTRKPKNWFIGQVLHLTTGAWLGLPIFYLFKKTGTKHHLVKGILAGSLVMELLYDLSRKLNIVTFNPGRSRTHYAKMWHNLLFGVVAAQTMVTLADPKMFETHTEENPAKSWNSKTNWKNSKAVNGPKQTDPENRWNEANTEYQGLH